MDFKYHIIPARRDRVYRSELHKEIGHTLLNSLLHIMKKYGAEFKQEPNMGRNCQYLTASDVESMGVAINERAWEKTKEYYLMAYNKAQRVISTKSNAVGWIDFPYALKTRLTQIKDRILYGDELGTRINGRLYYSQKELEIIVYEVKQGSFCKNREIYIRNLTEMIQMLKQDK